MARNSAQTRQHVAGILLLGLAACTATETDSGPTTASRASSLEEVPKLELLGDPDVELPFHESAASPSVIAYWARPPKGVESDTFRTLLIEGRGEKPVVARPRLVLEGLDDRSVEVELEALEVFPDEYAKIEIDLRKMPLQGVSHSVTLTAAVEFGGQDEDSTVTVRSEPLAFHFDDGYEQAFVYDLTTMVTEFGGGVLTKDPRTLVGRVQMDGETFDIAEVRAHEVEQEAKLLDEAPEDVVPASLSAVEFTYAFPEPEVGEDPIQELGDATDLGFAAKNDPAALSGPNPPGPTQPGPSVPGLQCLLFPWNCCSGDDCVDVCADWSTDFVDASNYGSQTEDYGVGAYSQSIDASYAPFEISKTTCSGPYCWTVQVDDGQLGPDGCASVNLPPGSGYAIRLTTNLRHGSGGHTYPVHYYPQNAFDAGVGLVAVSKGFTRYPNGVPLPPVPPTISMPYHPATNAAATISRVLASGALVGQSSGFLTRAGLGCLGYEEDGIPPTDACAGGELKTGPYLNPDNTPGDLRWKFVLAHEAGHVAQRKGPGPLANAYCFTASGALTTDCENNEPDHPNADASCRCDHVTGSNRLHCLQSLEHTTSAQVEGWAQFFSARVWNDVGPGCTFNYYKQFREDDGTVKQPPYKVACDDNVDWRDNHCYASWAGTEYDWLQFFWNLHAVGSYRYSVGNIFDTYKEACGGACYGDWVSWSNLSSAAATLFSSSKHAALVADGDVTGVDEDEF